MKLVLVVLGLSAVFAENIVPHTAYDYHRNIGVRQAARIRAAENALDFDGSRIAGGSVANLGQFPSLGGLVISLNNGATSVCGSSLVSNTHAVTAAHCWFDGRNQAIQFTVVLGSVRLFADGTRINTKNVLLHPAYNFQNANNDVALITIDRVTFSNTINRINLATGSNQFVGTWARAAGFGRTGDDVGISTAQVLSHVEVQVISNAECRQTFGSNILTSSICTSGANGRSPCGGDDGGPLQVGNTLIGIFSFVSGQGCTLGFPAVYARATSFASWVHARIR